MTQLTGPKSMADGTPLGNKPGAIGDTPAPRRSSIEEVEAERDKLRVELAAQREIVRATTDQLRSFEQLADAIRNARIYRCLRLLGRWKGVERTLTFLLESSVAQALATGSTPPDLAGVSHNFPKVLPADVNFLAGLRIRNAGHTVANLPPQHTRFWGSPGSAPQHAVAIELDGQLLLYGQLPADRIDPHRTATIFFPLQTGPEGTHRLQVFVASGLDALPEDGDRSLLFDLSYHVSRARATLDLRAALTSWAFMVRYARWPRLVAQWRCWRARVAADRTLDTDNRPAHLRRLKDQNKQLAFLEKQMRAAKVASRPCYLTVDTTADCNLRCPLCYREDADAAKVLTDEPHMPGHIFDELVRTLLPTAFTISPSGWGEPLLSPHLDSLIDACSSWGVYLSFTTNGVLLNKRGLLDRLVPVLHWLEISVDSVKAEKFEQFRAGARFEQVIRNAREVGRIRASLKDSKFSFGFSMTLFDDNLGELPAMIRLVADCGGNFLKTDIGVIFNVINLRQSVVRSPARYNEAYASAQQYARELGVNLFMRSPFVDDDHSEANRYGVCDFLYMHAGVTADGSYKPCYSMILPSRRNRKDATLLSLWNSPEMQRLRRTHDTPDGPSSCKTCYMTLRGRDSLEKRKERFIRLADSSRS